jgi:hypothetical protein
MDTGIITILADNLTRTLFERIARERRITYKDLLEAVKSSVNPDAAEPRLDQLRAAHLIEEQEAPLKDFRTYFVTANGLSAERELRRQQSFFATR